MVWILFVIALTAIALGVAVSGHGGLKSQRKSAEADAKGMQLLLDNLTPKQREQYRKFGYFDVLGSETGKWYRIHHGNSCNVNELINGRQRGGGRCFMPIGELVAGDCMLAQKIVLETREEEALRVARHF
jgi:hypothetical protein